MDSAEDHGPELYELVRRRGRVSVDRRVVVHELALLLDGGETVVGVCVGATSAASTLVLVTDRRILIGELASSGHAVQIEVVRFDELRRVEVDDAIKGRLILHADGRSVAVGGLSPIDAGDLARAVSRRVGRVARPRSTRSSARRPNDFDHLAGLLRLGVLSSEECEVVRRRLLRSIAARHHPDPSGDVSDLDHCD